MNGIKNLAFFKSQCDNIAESKTVFEKSTFYRLEYDKLVWTKTPLLKLAFSILIYCKFKFENENFEEFNIVIALEEAICTFEEIYRSWVNYIN